MAHEHGIIASTIRVADEVYVPGASRVQVSGIVSRVDSSTGTIFVGDLRIAQYEGLTINAKVGDYLKFSGVQPQTGREMLAE
jgi:hypothetical protein